MSKKQILVVILGTTALLLVVLLMAGLGIGASVDAASGSETDGIPVENTEEMPSLSGGNDCYCTEQSSPPTQDDSAQGTE